MGVEGRPQVQKDNVAGDDVAAVRRLVRRPGRGTLEEKAG